MRSTLHVQHASKPLTLRRRKLLAAMVVSIATIGNAQTSPAPHTQVAIVSGTVVDTTGAPIPGATISLELTDKPALRTTTDSNGHFDLKVEPGEYTLKTSAPGFMVDTIPLHLAAATQITEHIELRIGGGGGVKVAFENPSIETLDASLTATLPTMRIPLYKSASKKITRLHK